MRPEHGIESRWKSLLSKDEIIEYSEIIKQIANDLVKLNHQEDRSASLAGGTAGLSLFFAYLDQAFPDEGWKQHSINFFHKSLFTVSKEFYSPFFYSGFTGIGWVADHLSTMWPDLFTDDSNLEIDDALSAILSQTPWCHDFDLISGLVGYGTYQLGRRPSPLRHELIGLILDRLDETKKEVADGCLWFTPASRIPSSQLDEFPSGYFNFGISHGNPGVIAFLSKVLIAGIHEERANRLLKSAVAGLLSQAAINPRDDEFVFGYYSAKPLTSNKKNKSRVAWCYGDLGASIPLLSAAFAAHNSEWEKIAILCAKNAAAKSFEDSGCLDAGFCHGAAGNAHLFNRLFQATGEDVFYSAARKWLNIAFSFRTGKGIGGWQAYHTNPTTDHWVDDSSLLEGSTGIGLTLLGALGTTLPDWDRFLLVDLPIG